MAKNRKIDEKSGDGAPDEKKEKVGKWLKEHSEAATTEKKTKRLWRNKVRKLARKKAVAENSEESIILESEDVKKKTKRRLKKKKFKPEVVEKKEDVEKGA